MIRLVLLSYLLTGAAAEVGAQGMGDYHIEAVSVGDVGVVELPALGGTGGGQFQDACRAGELLRGFELRAADDVDAIRKVCFTAFENDTAEIITTLTIVEGPADPWHGGTGGSVTQLLCPPSTPIVIGVDIGAEGVNTIVVKTIHLFCGRAVNTQTAAAYPSVVFDGPPDHAAPAVFGIGGDSVHHGGGSERCPAGKVAVGMHGRSGIWLDAMGLICDSAVVEVTRKNSVALGRVPVPGSSPPLSVCEAAKDARARNSPAAASLEAQCRWQHSPEGAMEQAAQQGIPAGGHLNWSQSTPNAVGIHGSTTSVFNPTMAPRSIEPAVPTGSRAAVSAAATIVTRATMSTAVSAPPSGARAAVAPPTNAPPAAVLQGAAQMPAGRMLAAPGATVAAVASAAPPVHLPCLRPVTSGAGLQAATNHAGISVAPAGDSLAGRSVAGGTSTLPCNAEAMGNPQEVGQAAGLKSPR